MFKTATTVLESGEEAGLGEAKCSMLETSVYKKSVKPPINEKRSYLNRESLIYGSHEYFTVIRREAENSTRFYLYAPFRNGSLRLDCLDPSEQ